MVAHHDSLRINKTPEDNRLFYNPVHLRQPIKIFEIEAKGYGWENIEPEVQDAICAKFDLERDLLFRVYLIHAKEEQYLFFIFHHLIVDGISWQIFLHDLSLLLDEDDSSAEQNLPGKTASYAKYAKEYFHCSTEIEMYGSSVRGSISANELQITASTYGERIILRKILGKETSNSLTGKASSLYGTKTHELIVMALMIALSEQLGKDQAMFEIESHGRDVLKNLDVSRTIGWFTKIQSVILSIPPKELSEQLADMKKQLYTNNSLTEPLMKNEIRINYLGDLSETNNCHWILEGLGWDGDVSADNQWSYLMDANIYLLDGNLHITLLFIRNGVELANQFFVVGLIN